MPTLAELTYAPGRRPPQRDPRLMPPSGTPEDLLKQRLAAPPPPVGQGVAQLLAAPVVQPQQAQAIPIGAADATPDKTPLLHEIAKRQRNPKPKKTGRKAAEVDLLSSLLSKAVTGMAVPGEGMVPFGALPQDIRQAAGQVYKQPIVGFDPNQLTPREFALLQRLQGVGEGEVQKRVAAQPPKTGKGKA